jgi:cob(I)alamin adenosyltransferase
MRITRVYTRTGDRGQTRLVGGAVAAKDDVRIEAYGTVDELNAIIGLVRSANTRLQSETPNVQKIETILATIQNDLFNVGAELATPPGDRWEGMYTLGDADVGKLEDWIDMLNETLPPLKEFILPGGGPVGAQLHQARTVCRRAERRVVTLCREEPETGEGCLRYLNRLSDLLFVMGRWSAQALGEPEFFWKKPS